MPHIKVFETTAPWTQLKRLRLSSTIENDPQPKSLRLFVRSVEDAELKIPIKGENVRPEFLAALRLRLSERSPQTPNSVLLVRQVAWHDAIVSAFDLCIVLMSIAVTFLNLACAIEFKLNGQAQYFYAMVGFAALTSLLVAAVFAAFFRARVLSWNVVLIFLFSAPFAQALPLVAYFLEFDQVQLIKNLIHADVATYKWLSKNSLVLLLSFVCSYPQSLFLTVAMINQPQSATNLQIAAVALSASTIILRFIFILFEKLGNNLPMLLFLVCSVTFDLSAVIYCCSSLLEAPDDTKEYTLFGVQRVAWSGFAWSIVGLVVGGLLVVSSILLVGVRAVREAYGRWLFVHVLMSPLAALAVPFVLSLKMTPLALILARAAYWGSLEIQNRESVEAATEKIAAAKEHQRRQREAATATAAAAVASRVDTVRQGQNDDDDEPPAPPQLVSTMRSSDVVAPTTTTIASTRSSGAAATASSTTTAATATAGRPPLAPARSGALIPSSPLRSNATSPSRQQQQQQQQQNLKMAREDDGEEHSNNDDDGDDEVTSNCSSSDAMTEEQKQRQQQQREEDEVALKLVLARSDAAKNTVMERALSRLPPASSTLSNKATNSNSPNRGKNKKNNNKNNKNRKKGNSNNKTTAGPATTMLKREATPFLDATTSAVCAPPPTVAMTASMTVENSDADNTKQADDKNNKNNNNMMVLSSSGGDSSSDKNNSSGDNNSDNSKNQSSNDVLEGLDIEDGATTEEFDKKFERFVFLWLNFARVVFVLAQLANLGITVAHYVSRSHHIIAQHMSFWLTVVSFAALTIIASGRLICYFCCYKDDGDEQQAEATAGALVTAVSVGLYATHSSASQSRLKMIPQQQPTSTAATDEPISDAHLGASVEQPPQNNKNNKMVLQKPPLEQQLDDQSGAARLLDNNANNNADDGMNNNNKDDSTNNSGFTNYVLTREERIVPTARITAHSKKLEFCRTYAAVVTTNGRKHTRIAAVGTASWTEISRPMFNVNNRNFSIIFLCENFCNDDMSVGLVPPTRSIDELAEKQVWQLSDTVAISFRDSLSTPAIFVNGKAVLNVLPPFSTYVKITTLTLSVVNGIVSFDLNGARVAAVELNEVILTGLFRVAVSLPQAGQSIVVRRVEDADAILLQQIQQQHQQQQQGTAAAAANNNNNNSTLAPALSSGSLGLPPVLAGGLTQADFKPLPPGASGLRPTSFGSAPIPAAPPNSTENFQQQQIAADSIFAPADAVGEHRAAADNGGEDDDGDAAMMRRATSGADALAEQFPNQFDAMQAEQQTRERLQQAEDEREAADEIEQSIAQLRSSKQNNDCNNNENGDNHNNNIAALPNDPRSAGTSESSKSAWSMLDDRSRLLYPYHDDDGNYRDRNRSGSGAGIVSRHSRGNPRTLLDFVLHHDGDDNNNSSKPNLQRHRAGSDFQNRVRVRASFLRRANDDQDEDDTLSHIARELGPIGYCIYFLALAGLVFLLALLIFFRNTSNPVTILYHVNNFPGETQREIRAQSRSQFVSAGSATSFSRIVDFSWQCNTTSSRDIAVLVRTSLSHSGNSSEVAAEWRCLRPWVETLNSSKFVCSNVIQQSWFAAVCLAAQRIPPCAISALFNLSCTTEYATNSQIRECPVDATVEDAPLLCNNFNIMSDPDTKLVATFQGGRPLLTVGSRSQLVPINDTNPHVSLAASSCPMNINSNLVWLPYALLIVTPALEIAALTITQLGVVRFVFFLLYLAACGLQLLRRKLCGCSCWLEKVCCDLCRCCCTNDDPNDHSPLMSERFYSPLLFQQISGVGGRAHGAQFYHADFPLSFFGYNLGTHPKRAVRYKVVSWRRIAVPTSRGLEWRVAEFTLRRYYDPSSNPQAYEIVRLMSPNLLVQLLDVPLFLCYLRIAIILFNVGMVFYNSYNVFEWRSQLFDANSSSNNNSDVVTHTLNFLADSFINSSVFSSLLLCLYPVTKKTWGIFFLSPILGAIKEDECGENCRKCVLLRKEAAFTSRILPKSDFLSLADEVHHFSFSYAQLIPLAIARAIFGFVLLPLVATHVLLGSTLFPLTILGVALCAGVAVRLALIVRNHVSVIVLLFLMRVLISIVLIVSFQTSCNYFALLLERGFRGNDGGDVGVDRTTWFWILTREYESRSMVCFLESVREGVASVSKVLNTMKVYRFLFG